MFMLSTYSCISTTDFTESLLIFIKINYLKNDQLYSECKL